MYGDLRVTEPQQLAKQVYSKVSLYLFRSKFLHPDPTK